MLGLNAFKPLYWIDSTLKLSHAKTGVELYAIKIDDVRSLYLNTIIVHHLELYLFLIKKNYLLKNSKLG